jgi:hypothetical protein
MHEGRHDLGRDYKPKHTRAMWSELLIEGYQGPCCNFFSAGEEKKIIHACTNIYVLNYNILRTN